MSRIEKVETLSCAAGWRNYYFCKVTTSDSVVGWSEYDECFGSPGVTAVIGKLGRRLVGQSVDQTERFFADAYCATRPSFGGVTAQGTGALENALLDAKAKTLGVPCHVLLGGKIRDEIDVYWSHCATWRMSHAAHYGKKIADLDGVRAAGREARDAGFRALKTNLFSYGDGGPKAYRAGFGVPFEPGLNVTPILIRQVRAHLEAILDGAGDDCEVLLDLNFNFRTEGCLRILRELEDLPLFWVEIDSYNPEALAYIRQRSRHPISSCETLIGVREFMPFLAAQSIDVGIVDTVWNGVWQSLKIAAVAEAHEVNVAPHNFYGHVCTMMNAHFASVVPNLRVMELDVDRLPLDAELYTDQPEIRDGRLVVPDRPGWGIDPIEEVILAHPPKDNVGMYAVSR